MLDIYDKCYRYFDRQEIEGGSRQDEIFKKFIALVHENCIADREVPSTPTSSVSPPNT
jgi:hypothetical protein